MGYSTENFEKVRLHFNEKRDNAVALSNARLIEIHEKLPETQKIDEVLHATAARIIAAATSLDGKALDKKIAALKKENAELLQARRAILEKHGYPENYTDIIYECDVCKDTGYTETKMCDCMKKALVFAAVESSGMGNLIKKQSFENFDLSYYNDTPENMKNMTDNFNVMKHYATKFSGKACDNLFLCGKTGLGKTHLSSAAAKIIIERGFDVVYDTAQKILSDFEKERFKNTDGLCDKYYDCDLLIIDDLGTEINNQFTVACLYELINRRISLDKATLISTNVMQKELIQRYSERITSRLLGEFEVLVFTGKDVREQKLNR